MKKKIRNVLMLVFLATFVVSAWQVYRIRKEYKAGSDSYESLEQYISFEEPVPIATQIESSGTIQAEPTETAPVNLDETNWPNIDFDALNEINSDIVGWLYIEGTEINYPVVQGSDCKCQ